MDSGWKEEKERGNAAFSRGDYEAAVSAYSAGLAKDPSNAILFSNRSAAYIKLSKFVRALEDADKAIELSHGSFANAFVRRGAALKRLGRFDDAIIAFQRAMEVDSKNEAAADGLRTTRQLKLESDLHKHYHDRISLFEAGVSVKFIDEAIGKGLFAERDFSAGDCILRERPLMCIQWTRSRGDAICCSRCMRFVGPLSYQAAFLFSVQELSFPHSAQFDRPLPEFCGSCGVFPYCSVKCRSLDWDDHHSTLCPRPGSAALSFVQHVQSEGFDRFLLAAQIIINIVHRMQHHSLSLAEAWKPYSQLFAKDWLSVLQERVDSETLASVNSAATISHGLLKQVIAQAFPHLDQESAPYAELLSAERFRSLLGAFELNNPRVEITSPLYDYFVWLSRHWPRLVQTSSALQLIYNHINSIHGGVPPPCEGEGVFPLHSTINHSCCPSAKQVVASDSSSAEVVIVAAKNIKKGEEITISYIDLAEKNREQRREELQKGYLFCCNCPRCANEGV